MKLGHTHPRETARAQRRVRQGFQRQHVNWALRIGVLGGPVPSPCPTHFLTPAQPCLPHRNLAKCSQALGPMWEGGLRLSRACSQLGYFPPGSTPSSSSVNHPTSPSGSRPPSSPATSSSPKMPLTSATSGSSCPTTGGSFAQAPAPGSGTGAQRSPQSLSLLCLGEAWVLSWEGPGADLGGGSLRQVEKGHFTIHKHVPGSAWTWPTHSVPRTQCSSNRPS